MYPAIHVTAAAASAQSPSFRSVSQKHCAGATPVVHRDGPLRKLRGPPNLGFTVLIFRVSSGRLTRVSEKSGVNEPYRKATRAPSCRQVRVRCLRELLRKGSVQMFHREVDDLVGGLPDRPRAEPQSLNAHVKGLSCTSRARFVSALEEAFHPRQNAPVGSRSPRSHRPKCWGPRQSEQLSAKGPGSCVGADQLSASGGCRRPAAGCSPKGWPPPCRH